MKFKGIAYQIIHKKNENCEFVLEFRLNAKHYPTDVWYGNNREQCLKEIGPWADHHGLTIVITGDIYEGDYKEIEK